MSLAKPANPAGFGPAVREMAPAGGVRIGAKNLRGGPRRAAEKALFWAALPALYRALLSAPHTVMPGAGPASMCGRPFGFKGALSKKLVAGTSAVMCPALRCGVMTAAQMVCASEPSTRLRCRDAPLDAPGYLARRFDRSPSSAIAPFTLADERLSRPAVGGTPRHSSSWPTRHGPSCWPTPRRPACAAGAAPVPAATRCPCRVPV